jgi:hypothetical protein
VFLRIRLLLANDNLDFTIAPRLYHSNSPDVFVILAVGEGEDVIIMARGLYSLV